MQTDTVTVRNAVPGDLPALVALSQKTFTDKFGHLYHPEDLATFLAESHGEVAYGAYLADPDNLIRVAEYGDGKLGAYLLCSPLSLPADGALTGAVESTATTLPEVIQETLLTTTSERQGRVIDKDEGGAGMEKKKQEGYF